MRTITLLLSFLFVALPLQAELSVQNIEKMVRDIKSDRSSTLSGDVNISSPFIMVKQDENRTVATIAPAENTQTVFALGAIVNSTAFIDGIWRKVGDPVGDFRLESVAGDHVVLKRKNRTITLFFKPTKHILNIGKE